MSNEQLAMSNDKSEIYFIEQRIISAVRGLLTGRVNELLRGYDFQIPVVEFSECGCGYGVTPKILLSSCERSEKERIINVDTYSLTVSFCLPDKQESLLCCYAYGVSFKKALCENVTLGGIVDRALIVSKKFVPPKVQNAGMELEYIITLRITVETMNE